MNHPATTKRCGVRGRCCLRHSVGGTFVLGDVDVDGFFGNLWMYLVIESRGSMTVSGLENYCIQIHPYRYNIYILHNKKYIYICIFVYLYTHTHTHLISPFLIPVWHRRFNDLCFTSKVRFMRVLGAVLVKLVEYHKFYKSTVDLRGFYSLTLQNLQFLHDAKLENFRDVCPEEKVF